MKTILIIEDNNDIRESTAEILELTGFNVLQANNGKAGVELASKYKPDLILCDIMMPELDGHGVLYLLNKHPDTASIPFIFLTAKAERVDFRKAMEMGADDYLTKPFDDIELLNAIECRLNKKEKQESFFSQSWAGIEKLTIGKGMEELKKLVNQRKIRVIKKKQVIYFEGDHSQGLYLILEGVVKVVKLAEDGRELLIGLYKADDYLGLNALLIDDAFTETAEAVEDSTLCLLPKDEILKLLSKYPEIGQQFMKLLSNNIREKEEQLLQMAYKSVRKRLAQVLIGLSKQFTNSLDLKISRQELASMAGMATETVSRTLTDFKEEKLIVKKGSCINILDMDKLVKMKN